ncbi:hypothetical protein O6H91_04G115300 [Diphasiastrum complanatum]|uniref:Uncharacterized protein n=1 Tax=Diphasiastrum complanatum TaxID=34168 RepID=A0ACC2E0R9_DIPCM|nr:hypothetical protein O6H91_04G115300 [Diphasiastrum complanatum]
MASIVYFLHNPSPFQPNCDGSFTLAQTHLPKTPTSSNACLCWEKQWMAKQSSRLVASPPSSGLVSQFSAIPKNGKESLEAAKAVLQSQEGGGVQAGVQSSSSEEAPRKTFPRESVTHVASESALESPEKVHEEAEEEAQLIAAEEEDGSVEEISEDLEKEADKAAEIEAEILESPAIRVESNLETGATYLKVAGDPGEGAASAIKLHEIREGVMVAAKKGIKSAKTAMDAAIAAGGNTREGYERAREAMQPHIAAASQIMEGVMDSGRYARQNYGSVKEAVDKRLKGLAEATEEARDVSAKVVEMARKRWEDLRQHAEELHGYAIEVAEQMDKDTQPEQSSTPEDGDQGKITQSSVGD